MAVLVVFLVLFLAMTGQSSATFCICKDGLSDSVLQKNIDYACGAGADCTQISQSGPCYNPNTVKDHCSYAVNSYFQRKGQAVGSCDFQGTAIQTQNSPSQSSTCVYPASPSNSGTTPGGSTTPTPGGSITPTPPGGSTTPTPGGSTTPTTPGGSTTPTTPGGSTAPVTPGTTTPIGTPGSANTPSVFGLGPTGSGITSTDSKASVTLHQTTTLFCSFIFTLLFSGLVWV